MSEKRCKFCGHPGRLTPILNRWFDRIDDYRCTDVGACNDRVRNLGKWIGKRVLRRRDRNGTEWTIRRHDDLGNRGIVGALCDSGVVLMMEYRGHRLVSQHPDIPAAQAHADDLIASMTDRDIDAYREPVADDQMELL